MMIAVVILGILLSIAIPSYQQHVATTATHSAEAALAGLALAMERHRAQTGTYAGAALDENGDVSAIGVPAIYATQSPENGTADFTLTIASADATSYSLSATPTGTVKVDHWISVDSLGKKTFEVFKDSTCPEGETCSELPPEDQEL
ncbi:hypothetical protein EZMO1_1536 [Endozoicomonas montiporae CL-33]|uniref:Type IV pilus assembly protein PilA n=2 Tax=Endozoicomonas montiporae TaxID=1027273 RepID=A0A142BAC6_9GAMM|nr:hypothetical protein EZMO1_1536 [Endozoicomonas montiporae CL-33]